jgi:formate hydrogenlyase subunit 6/NADH:ubiquinone oxidoreductase subunit I
MNYLSQDNLFALLDALKTDYEVFVPVKKGPFRFYQPYTSPDEDMVIGEVRATEPLKGFFTPVKEKVAELFNPEPPRKKQKPMAIVGVKACDLKGFLVQDQVFCKGCPDPFYNRARQDNLIISADCTLAIDSCFCLSLNVNPYPESHFDINLSQVTDGFVAEVGSLKGQQIFDKHQSLFQEATPSVLSEKEMGRKQTVGEVQQNIDKHRIPHQDEYRGMIERNYDSSIWEEEAKTCTECGACNTICPTCHCFQLTDEKEDDKVVRYRQWDSCMVKDFARVAGGGNPRPQLWMRLRNRFEKKFDFFSKVADLYACTGCGRCITACPANIDIRQVIKRLVHNE